MLTQLLLIEGQQAATLIGIDLHDICIKDTSTSRTKQFYWQTSNDRPERKGNNTILKPRHEEGKMAVQRDIP